MLFNKNTCKISVSITPNEINNNIDENLKNRIKVMVEGKCIREGFVRPGSVEILRKGPGTMMMNQFNGNIKYNVEYSCDICDPKEGMEIKCKILNINKMGILASGGNGCLNILLARAHHQELEEFNDLKEDENILVSVVGIRKEYNDNQISVIAKYIKSLGVEKDLVEENTSVVMTQSNQKETPSVKITNKTKKYKVLTMVNMDSEFTYKDVSYKSILHAFNAQKSIDPKYQALFNKTSPSYVGDDTTLVKKAATKTNMKKIKVKMIDNWEDKSKDILKEIATHYFKSNSSYLKKLKDTGATKIIYDYYNDYADNLMELRVSL